VLGGGNLGKVLIAALGSAELDAGIVAATIIGGEIAYAAN
jgi:hypothetical protein